MPVELKAELEREGERLVLVERQIEQLEATRRERLQHPRSEAERRVVHLMRLGAIGPTSAWLTVRRFMGGFPVAQNTPKRAPPVKRRPLPGISIPARP